MCTWIKDGHKEQMKVCGNLPYKQTHTYRTHTRSHTSLPFSTTGVRGRSRGVMSCSKHTHTHTRARAYTHTHTHTNFLFTPQAFEDATLAVKGGLSRFTPQGMTQTLSSLGRMGYRPTEALHRAVNRYLSWAPHLGRFRAVDIATLMHALAKLEVPLREPVYESLLAKINWWMFAMQPAELANVCWALARIGAESPACRWVGRRGHADTWTMEGVCAGRSRGLRRKDPHAGVCV